MKISSLFASWAAIAAVTIAQQVPASESLEVEAIKQATSTFSSYIVQCDGKTYGQMGDGQFIEFSGPFQEPGLKYTGDVEEYERLNGVVWAGTLEANLGQAARIIHAKPLGGVNVKDWEKLSPVNFRYQLKNGHWEIANSVGRAVNEIDTKLLYWGTIRPGVTCTDIPKIPG